MKKLILSVFFIAGSLGFNTMHSMQTSNNQTKMLELAYDMLNNEKDSKQQENLKKLIDFLKNTSLVYENKEEIVEEKSFISKRDVPLLFDVVQQYSVDAFKKYLKDNNINSNAEVQQGHGNLLGFIINLLGRQGQEQYQSLLGMLEFLLNTGADVNAVGYNNSSTPLMSAAAKGSADAVKILLAQKNIDLNKQNINYKNATALYLAVAISHEPEIVKLLLQAGADQTIKTDKHGKFENPLEYAQRTLKDVQDDTHRIKLEKIIKLLETEKKFKETIFHKTPKTHDIHYNYQKYFDE